jgi:hypothetical protein
MYVKMISTVFALLAALVFNNAQAVPMLRAGFVDGDSVVNDPYRQKAWADTLGGVIGEFNTCPDRTTFTVCSDAFDYVDSYIAQLNAEQYGGATGWRLPNLLELKDLFVYRLGNEY